MTLLLMCYKPLMGKVVEIGITKTKGDDMIADLIPFSSFKNKGFYKNELEILKIYNDKKEIQITFN